MRALWISWLRLCRKFDFYIECFFERYTRLVTKYHIVVIIVCLGISGGLMSGFYWLKEEHQTTKLYFPLNSQSYRDLDRTESTFSSYHTFFDFIITSNTADKNVIRDDVFKLALQVHLNVTQVKVEHGKKVLKLKDICVSYMKSCVYTNLLSLFNYNASLLQNVSVTLNMLYGVKGALLSHGRNLEMSMRDVIGKYEINGSVVNAEAIRFIYPIYFAKTANLYERNTLVEQRLHELFEIHRKNAADIGLQLDYRTAKSGDDGVDNSSSETFYVSIAITVTVLLCSLLTMNCSKPIKSHSMLSNVGVIAVGLGIGAAFGLAMLVGKPFVAFVGTLPFLVLAIGVDDMFIIFDELDTLNGTIMGNERLIKAVKKVGGTITMTSLTDVVAFAVTADSDLLSVRYFCFYAALSITFSFLMTMTLVLAFGVLDIKRIEKGRCDLVPCMPVTNGSNGNPWLADYTPISEKLMEVYGKYLMKSPTKIVVVMLYIAMTAAGGYAATKVNVSFSQKDMATPGTYQHDWLVTMETYFPSVTWNVNVVLQDEQFEYSNNHSIQVLLDVDEYAAKSEHFKKETFNWASTFVKWTKSRGANLDRHTFYGLLRWFLQSHPFFLVDIKFSLGPTSFLHQGLGKITASRVVLFTKDNSDWKFQQTAMNKLRDHFERIKESKNVELIAIAFPWIFLELLNTIPMDLLKNLCISAAAITIITLLYVCNPIISIVMLFMFSSISVLLLALMYVWNVDMNGVTLIIITMSIGFSVDYMAHVAHAYVLAEQPSPEERMVFALKTIGRSVVKGGVTTFVGITVSALSKSPFFQIFFKLMLGIIGLGLLHGLLFLPVFLTIFARSKLDISKHTQSTVDHNIVISNNSIKLQLKDRYAAKEKSKPGEKQTEDIADNQDSNKI